MIIYAKATTASSYHVNTHPHQSCMRSIIPDCDGVRLPCSLHQLPCSLHQFAKKKMDKNILLISYSTTSSSIPAKRCLWVNHMLHACTSYVYCLLYRIQQQQSGEWLHALFFVLPISFIYCMFQNLCTLWQRTHFSNIRSSKVIAVSKNAAILKTYLKYANSRFICLETSNNSYILPNLANTRR